MAYCPTISSKVVVALTKAMQGFHLASSSSIKTRLVYYFFNTFGHDWKAGDLFTNFIERVIDGADTAPRDSPLSKGHVAMGFDNLITIGIFPQKATAAASGGLQVFEGVAHGFILPPVVVVAFDLMSRLGLGLICYGLNVAAFIGRRSPH